jgi:hypothetical protein
MPGVTGTGGLMSDGETPATATAAPPGAATATEAREFAAAFRSFLEWVHRAGDQSTGNPVVQLVTRFLGEVGVTQSVVTRQLPPFEHVNLQTALDSWSAQPGRDVQVHGVAMPPHFGTVSLQQLISGEALPPLQLSAPGLVDLPNGPGTTLACLTTALLLVTDTHGRYVVMVAGPSEHRPELMIEVAGLPVAAAQSLLAELDELRSRLNVYRGQVVEVVASPMGGARLVFADLPRTARADVVLPEVVLGRVERHALGVAEHREALLAAGQHLKRGLLLYGPPGTGKTHTTRYLVGQMAEYTRLLLSGRSLHLVGSITDLARDLQPAVVVLEDVDLVAEDRSFGPAGNPVLFELLDAMDGAAGDADLLFLLTTNRADLLETALAARPGRVDVAVQIDLPDDDSRRRLLQLYGRGVPLQLTEADLDDAVTRTEDVTASFIKELIRRAVLESLRESSPLTVVTAAHLSSALDDLLDSSQHITRALLGVGVDPGLLPPGAVPSPGWQPGMPAMPAMHGPPMHLRGRAGGGWFAYGG